MRLRGSRAYYRPSPPKMPPGLIELMEGLTKEVLKRNPSDIYEFCASHMEQLLEKRDGPSPKKSLSLQEKIARAQQKVRQRADKHREEFDKRFLQERSNDLMNEEMQDDFLLLTSSVPSVSDNITLESNKDDPNVLPEEQSEKIIKGHHKLDLEKNVQVEIAQDTSSDIYAQKEGNIIVQKNSEQLLENGNSIKDNKMKQDALPLGLVRDTKITDMHLDHVKNYEWGDNEGLSSTSTVLSPVEQHTEHIEVEETANGDLIDQEPPFFSIESNQNLTPDIDRSEKNDKAEPNEAVLVNEVSKANLILDTDRSDENDKEKVNKFVIVNEVKVSKGNLTPDTDRSYKNDKELKVPAIVNEVKPTGMIIGEQNDINMFHVDSMVPSKFNSNTHDNHTKNIEVEHKEPAIVLASDKVELLNIEQLDVKIQQTVLTPIPSQIAPLMEKEHTKDFHNLHIDNIQVLDKSATVIPKSNINVIQQGNNILALESNSDILQESDESIYTPIINISNTDIEHSKEQNTIENLRVDDTPNYNETKLNTPVNSVDAESADSNLTTLRLENPMSEEKQINNFIISPSEIKNEMPFEDDYKIDKENAYFKEIISDSTNVSNSEQNIEDKSTDLGVNSSSITTQYSITSNDNSDTERLSHMSESIQNDNLNTTNMDLETAAITIQKVFRNFLFKSRGGTFDETSNDGTIFLDDDVKNKEECAFAIESALNKDRRAHGITRTDTILQTVNEEKSLSLSTDDSSTLSSAATTIQAHVRGFLVRNRLSSNKTVSSNSLAACNSNDPSLASLETDNDQNKSKTILNIHIVPEGGDCLSRDESLINSMDLSLDSPTSSINLHPLSDDKSERRRRLKREDAIQSISPPSNNSGKLSEDFDSVKEITLIEHEIAVDQLVTDNNQPKSNLDTNVIKSDSGPILSANKVNTEVVDNKENNIDDPDKYFLGNKIKSLTKMNSDERDVVTPFPSDDDNRLMHSGEFHDVVLPTKVSRCDTSVVREFKNVLVYFLLWNHS